MPPPLTSGLLEGALEARIGAAAARGALQPIVTDRTFVDDGGVRFVVRSIAARARRPAAPPAEGAPPDDPFDPWEPDLFVADVTAGHVALLNKFPVLDRHVLIVTRRFVDQETLLDAHDFEAAAACLAEIDGLVFYNAGPAAGASQPHRHLQIVPLPLVPGEPRVPVQPLLDAAAPGADRLPGFGFRHAFQRLPGFDAATLRARYEASLDRVGISTTSAEGARAGGGERRQSGPYNLLVTREWMLLVARRRARSHGVPVNALGFAGSLFVPDAERLAALRAAGPLAVLHGVSR